MCMQIQMACTMLSAAYSAPPKTLFAFTVDVDLLVVVVDDDDDCSSMPNKVFLKLKWDSMY